MDVVMIERINKLARSLRDLHLVASLDEAYKRAEEILLANSVNSSKSSGEQGVVEEEKTLNELMGVDHVVEEKMSEVKDMVQPENVVEEIFIDSKEDSSEEKKREGS